MFSQNEIKMILSESVSRSQNSGPCDFNQQLSRRRKELASFMGSLLEEMAKAEAAKVGISSESTSVLGRFPETTKINKQLLRTLLGRLNLANHITLTQRMIDPLFNQPVLPVVSLVESG